jgi:hypothetical protein
LAQLPRSARDEPILVRAGTSGATHALTDHLRQLGVRFSIGLPADERVRAAVLAVAADAWQLAIDVDGQPRPGAQVAELHTLDLADWPVGRRAICRREDPHPGAQLSFTMPTGTASKPSSPTSPIPDLARLELRELSVSPASWAAHSGHTSCPSAPSGRPRPEAKRRCRSLDGPVRA